ncbi:MAG: DUF1800 domain-containing protein [Pseudomonadota bacterium]
MAFDPERAAIRFGCGLAPDIAPPRSATEMLDRLAEPDTAAHRFPVPAIDTVLHGLVEIARLSRTARAASGSAERDAARDSRKARLRAMRLEAGGWFRHALLRRITTNDGFRERLVSFWGDHFTAHGKGPARHLSYLPYLEDAIRPHVTERFADMLKAVITHPVLLRYLDQPRSAGPSSRAARRRGGPGLNENLAREVLELHTLGVGASYTPRDVRALATLFTGLSIAPDRGFVFRENLAEPGQITVLNRVYGGKSPSLRHVFQALEDLAAHPATALHLARKLARHFVSDTPDPALISALQARYIETDGTLSALYESLLDHPSAWRPEAGNVKQPFDFMASALRALGLMPEDLPTDPGRLRRLLHTPLGLMGQPFGQPRAPDGWPEADADWITPQGMAARLNWAMTVPTALADRLPDPRVFAATALGSRIPEPVRFAAAAAETRADGVALVLSAPAFQRM